VIDVHAHHEDFNVKSAETEKEVEDLSKKERIFDSDTGLLVYMPVYYQRFLQTLNSSHQTNFNPNFKSYQLLRTLHISLPPPFLLSLA
jgi:hypothetical protein